mmetsp:Transcript_33331/g.105174  ORF Transcript_33331/g.105174 Transcript_33331/m.105174 type:complete len:250 (-) Transcript_33331:99-848(-)
MATNILQYVRPMTLLMAAEVICCRIHQAAACSARALETCNKNQKQLQLRRLSAVPEGSNATTLQETSFCQGRRRMKSQTFVFRQFSVQQDRCAMKVGTDAVLLGAWAGIPPEGNLALDIGTGTGVLCLMVAQRASKYRVHAVEIEPSCAEQANENVLRSKWSDRIEVKGCSIQSWRTNCNAQYDLIISNPPYFKPLLNKEPIDASCGGLDPSSNARRIARETLLLSHAELLQSVKMLLKKSGAFCPRRD